MKNTQPFTEFELLSSRGTNPFCAEYENSLMCRRSASGVFTLWIHHWPSQAGTPCREGNITSPEQFVQACDTCLDFADFGGAGVTDAVRSGFGQIQRIDPKFAEALRAHLLCEFDVDCSEPSIKPEKPDTSENLRERLGASWTFVPFRPR